MSTGLSISLVAGAYLITSLTCFVAYAIDKSAINERLLGGNASIAYTNRRSIDANFLGLAVRFLLDGRGRPIRLGLGTQRRAFVGLYDDLRGNGETLDFLANRANVVGVRKRSSDTAIA